MKKSLVLAMAMALGVTVSAHAANPFSDVPAGHWAYDSVAKLAAAGVVDGYPDGTFRGDRLMTRYEMAQIIAKAMARGANVDRLAAEFAEELDALGVRVAALEKKADNVKITGNVRYSYKTLDNHLDKQVRGSRDADQVDGKHSDNKLRTRLIFTGDVNKDWKYVGLIQNNQNLKNNEGEEGINFQRAYLDGRLGGMHVTAGRFNNTLADGNLYDNRMDGVKAAYGSKVKVGGYYAKPTDLASGCANFMKNTRSDDDKFERAWGVNTGVELGKLTVFGGFDRFDRMNVYNGTVKMDINNLDIWNAGMTYNFGEASLGTMYLHSNLKKDNIGNHPDHDGFVITGTVKGAKASKPGSWGLEAKYYDQGEGTFLAHTMNGDPSIYVDQGFTGYKAAASVTVAKNMVGTVEYYELKGKIHDEKQRTVWSELMVTF